MATRKKPSPFSDIEGDLVRAVKAERAQARAKRSALVEPVEDIQRRTDLSRADAQLVQERQQPRHNDQFKVLEFKHSHSTNPITVEVYILDPGQRFEGFGGSRHALTVTKKASLIIRVKTKYDLWDREYDANCRMAWQTVREGLARAFKEGGFKTDV